jgi:hypothetical protein
LAIRSDIWLSSEDTCFIKPKDFPACSTTFFAWRFNSDNRLLRSAILDKYSEQWQEADKTSELDIFIGGKPRSKDGDPPSYPRWKIKEQGKTTQTQGMLGIIVS